MNYYNQIVAREPLAPDRTDTLASMESTISLLELKQQLGYISGDGVPYEDAAQDATLQADLEWATDLVTAWLGRPVVVEEIVDYYPTLREVMEVSSSGIIEDSPTPTLEVIREGATTFTPVQYTLDKTILPSRIRVTDPPTISSDFALPVRFSYNTGPLEHKGLGKVTGCIIDLIRIRTNAQTSTSPMSVPEACRKTLALYLGRSL